MQRADSASVSAVNSDDEWPDDNAEESDFDEELLLEAAEAERSKQRRSSGKHWTKSEFPEGSSKNNIMHAGNLEAALNWRCPCVDRNCLGAQRVNMVDIYKARQQFHSDVLHSLRDKARKRLEDFGALRQAHRHIQPQLCGWRPW